MSERKGDWMQTVSGRRFYPLDPRPEEIHLEDIAHALSHTCRFGGHVLKFYSVAQHCVHVSRLVDEKWALVALLHDAPEAFIGDMIWPIKVHVLAFVSMEIQIWKAVADRFGLPHELPPAVKRADNVALMTERRDLMTPTIEIWRVREQPDQLAITRPWTPTVARRKFIQRFKELGGVAS